MVTTGATSATGTVVTVAGAGGPMLVAMASTRADVLPPPTFVIDFLYLGFPLGIVAGVAIVAAAILVYRRARRRWRRALSVFVTMLVVAAANFAIYLVVIDASREARSRRQLERMQRDQAPAVTAPTASPAGTSPIGTAPREP
jgi:hypothetical protein